MLTYAKKGPPTFILLGLMVIIEPLTDANVVGYEVNVIET